MVTCQVAVTGLDRQLHAIEITDATSLYDAADKAIKAWERLWWFSYEGELIVKHPEKGAFTVQQAAVRKWRAPIALSMAKRWDNLEECRDCMQQIRLALGNYHNGRGGPV